jgi:hypothetical protein
MPKARRTKSGFVTRVVAGDNELPLARLQHPRQHLDRRRLAGAVGAEKAEDDSRLHRERDVVDGGKSVEALDQIADLDDRGRHFTDDSPRPGLYGYPEPTLCTGSNLSDRTLRARPKTAFSILTKYRNCDTVSGAWGFNTRGRECRWNS